MRDRKKGGDLKTAREGEKEVELKSSEREVEGGARAKEPATGIV